MGSHRVAFLRDHLNDLQSWKTGFQTVATSCQWKFIITPRTPTRLAQQNRTDFSRLPVATDFPVKCSFLHPHVVVVHSFGHEISSSIVIDNNIVRRVYVCTVDSYCIGRRYLEHFVISTIQIPLKLSLQQSIAFLSLWPDKKLFVFRYLKYFITVGNENCEKTLKHFVEFTTDLKNGDFRTVKKYVFLMNCIVKIIIYPMEMYIQMYK